MWICFKIIKPDCGDYKNKQKLIIIITLILVFIMIFAFQLFLFQQPDSQIYWDSVAYTSHLPRCAACLWDEGAGQARALSPSRLFTSCPVLNQFTPLSPSLLICKMEIDPNRSTRLKWCAQEHGVAWQRQKHNAVSLPLLTLFLLRYPASTVKAFCDSDWWVSVCID